MKRLLLLSLAFACIAVLIVGCAQRSAVSPDGSQQTRDEQKPKDGDSGKKGPEKITDDKLAKVDSKDLAGKGDEVSGMFQDIHFDFDKYDIQEGDKAVLKSVADHLIKNSAHKILIEGHCDERGTNEYNLALGDRRAKAAKDYVVSLGVPSARIDTISYGEEKPLCKEQTEDCWAKNRRGHFIVVKGKK